MQILIIIYSKTTNPMKTQKITEDLIENDMYVYNVYQSRQKEEQLILMMSILRMDLSY